MTHRMFSRNASSSRAIPVAKMIEQVRNDPAMPIYWGMNQPGMQSAQELEGDAKQNAIDTWIMSANLACLQAEIMVANNVHKQVANRLLEPFQWMHVVCTATEWDNFFELRLHPAAQPEIQELARVMKEAIDNSAPSAATFRGTGVWHLPYITHEERMRESYLDLAKMSAARCARVSYMKHDGGSPSKEEDLKLFDRLVGSKPIHASPTEHQATPLVSEEFTSGNFKGWCQFRKIIEAGLI